MFAVKNRKIFFTLSLVMVLISYVLMIVWGFNVGTDFKGGFIAEIRYVSLPQKSLVEESVSSLGLGNASIRAAGSNGYIIRMADLTIEQQENLKQKLLTSTGDFEIERFNSVGPTIGKELQEKAIIAIAGIIIITVVFIAYSFRQISKPISSWKYGLVSIVALVHDISIPAGAAVILGRFYGMEIDALFITALLSLLGYSINDTIIIFDRIRTNLNKNKDSNLKESFDYTIGKSLSETYGRSINTSLTVFLVLVSLYFFGAASIKFFILTLIVGTIAGAYSSIYIAAPLLVSINKQKQGS